MIPTVWLMNHSRPVRCWHPLLQALKLTGLRAIIQKGWGGLGTGITESHENVLFIGQVTSLGGYPPLTFACTTRSSIVPHLNFHLLLSLGSARLAV